MKTKRKKLIEKLDNVFGNYIRLRDAGKCITCGSKFDPTDRVLYHAGHFISRSYHSLRWDEKNVYGQCRSCNCKQNLKGNSWMQTCLMRDGILDLKEIEEMHNKCHGVFKVPLGWFEDQIKKYEELLKEFD